MELMTWRLTGGRLLRIFRTHSYGTPYKGPPYLPFYRVVPKWLLPKMIKSPEHMLGSSFCGIPNVRFGSKADGCDAVFLNPRSPYKSMPSLSLVVAASKGG